MGKHFLTKRNTKENYQLAVWEQVILQQLHFKGRETEFSYLTKEIKSLNTQKKNFLDTENSNDLRNRRLCHSIMLNVLQK